MYKPEKPTNVHKTTPKKSRRGADTIPKARRIYLQHQGILTCLLDRQRLLSLPEEATDAPWNTVLGYKRVIRDVRTKPIQTRHKSLKLSYARTRRSPIKNKSRGDRTAIG